MIRTILDFCIRERLDHLACFGWSDHVYGWHSTRKVPLDAIPNVERKPGHRPHPVERAGLPRTLKIKSLIRCRLLCKSVPGSKSVRG